MSGGLSKENTATTTGIGGAAVDESYNGFLRADYRYGDTKLRAFMNRGTGEFADLNALAEPSEIYNTYDFNLQRAQSLPFDQSLIVGGSYRRNTMWSPIFQPGCHAQDLWSLFFEDEWKPLDRLVITASGRLDRHPLTPLGFSPHGSALFKATDAQIVRLSAGTSFRNPTLLENYLQFSQAIPNVPGTGLPNPPFSSVQNQLLGNQRLDPEKMFQIELAHEARFGAVETSASVYYYKINNLINVSPTTVLSLVPPTAQTQTTYYNHGGDKAIGFQFRAKAKPTPWLDVFANYSYQQLKDDDPAVGPYAPSAPRHKVNAGVTAKRRGLTTSLWSDWVDKTYWIQSQQGTVYGKVPDYLLLNGRIGYAFSGRGEGWEVALSGFNMLDRAHYEILPATGPTTPGQNGEIVRSRWMGSVTYRF